MANGYEPESDCRKHTLSHIKYKGAGGLLKILFTEAPAEMHKESIIGLKYIQGSKYQNNTNQFQIPAWKTRGVLPLEKFSTPPKVPSKSNLGALSQTFHNDFQSQ